MHTSGIKLFLNERSVPTVMPCLKWKPHHNWKVEIALRRWSFKTCHRGQRPSFRSILPSVLKQVNHTFSTGPCGKPRINWKFPPFKTFSTEHLWPLFVQWYAISHDKSIRSFRIPRLTYSIFWHAVKLDTKSWGNKLRCVFVAWHMSPAFDWYYSSRGSLCPIERQGNVSVFGDEAAKLVLWRLPTITINLK